MDTHKITAYLITNRADHYYLTGFSGEDSAVLVTRSAVWVITDRRFETSAKSEVGWARISFRDGLLVTQIANTLKEAKINRLAIQSESLTVETKSRLARSAKGVRLMDAPPFLESLRCIKDSREKNRINEAVRIAENAFRAMLKTIRLGQTELELAARLEYEMKRRGSQKPAFDTIVAIDSNAALPHAFAGDRRVRKGSTVLVDWGATYGFYRSDLTRTFFIGSIPPTLSKVYSVVLAAQKRAIAAIKPGARMCDVDAVARKYIAGAGFGDRFTHGLGHGIGLDIHEAPSLSWRSDKPLKAGMVVTVEPGVYLPGVGGVRIEDDVLVSSRGPQILSRLGKSLRSAVVEL